MSAVVGSAAPPFSLPDQEMHTVTLDDLKGRKSVIIFIPFPFTGICDDEGCAIRDGLSLLSQLDANVAVITCHAVPVVRRWSDEFGFTFPVLSDFWPHGFVTTRYGAFNEAIGAANRMSFVVDTEGTIRAIIDSGDLSVGREFEEYTTALARLT